MIKSRVVSNISKHKSYKFILWKISCTREFVSLYFDMNRDEYLAVLVLRKLQNHLLTCWLLFLQACISNDRIIWLFLSLRFDNNKRLGVLNTLRDVFCAQWWRTQNVKYNWITPNTSPVASSIDNSLSSYKQCITLEQEITELITKTKTLKIFCWSLLLKRTKRLVTSTCTNQRFFTLDTRFARFSRHFLASFLKGVKCASLHRSLGPFLLLENSTLTCKM